MPFGIDTSSFETGAIPNWFLYIILIVGLLLCFFGEIIWEFMVSILGAIIGSIIGYAIGIGFGNLICAFGLMFLFAIIGSILFQMLAKAAVALLCALLAFGGAAYLTYMANQDNVTAPVMVGLIVGIIVFVVALMFVEEIVGVFLAAIGGFLVGAAVYFLISGRSALVFAVLAGGSMFILGAIFQVMVISEKKRPLRAPPRRRPVRETRPAASRKRVPSTSKPKPPKQGSSPPQTGSG
ncbi:MAG: hypothetical protein JSV56_00270 [Methanomassiliicoccales archaeon]|nr:MAG: hypothetical protein JSV56_00270 [Methanomassiliicoccales archaeon]